MSNVKIVKLRSGEDIIAIVSNETATRHDNVITLKSPCRAVPIDNKGTIGLAPWSFLCKEAWSELSVDKPVPGDGITIPLSEVVFIGTPIDSILNDYNALFGNGLVLPNSNKTVTAANGFDLKLSE